MVIQWNTNESGKTLCYADPVYCSQPINFGLGGFIRVCEYMFPIRISYLDLHEEYENMYAHIEAKRKTLPCALPRRIYRLLTQEIWLRGTTVQSIPDLM